MTETNHPEVPSAADVREFSERGVVCLRGVFTDWVDTLRVGVEENMQAPGPWVKHYTPDGNPGHFFGDYCNWSRIDAYRKFVHDSPAGRIASALMGSRSARFFHEHVLVKEASTREATPWHHDQPYYPIDGQQNCSLWIPLDDVASNSCPEFIAGSHRWGKWFVPTRFTGQVWDRESDREQLELVPDVEARRDEFDIVSFALEPGDAIAFHFLTVHGAPPNRSASRRRRGFSARLLGDDATWAVRSGPTSPPFPELSGRLQAGDSLDGVAEFPLVYPREA